MNKICIIGLGLLGGSIGKECISKNLAKQVVGFGRNSESLKKAKQLGLVHEISESFEDLNQADLIAAATAEKTALLERLRAYFDETSRAKLLERKSVEQDALIKELDAVPRVIYIG